MSETRKSGYQRIVEAAKHGKGVRLTPEEVRKMANDDAIIKVAEHHDNDTGAAE